MMIKKKKGIGYLCVLGILFLTLIPFASRISALSSNHQTQTSHCHKTSSETHANSDSTDHAAAHTNHAPDIHNWTSACEYCELFMHVPVLIYDAISITESFVPTRLVENQVTLFLVVYHHSYNLIRAPPSF